jgi:uncharacterized protein YggE
MYPDEPIITTHVEREEKKKPSDFSKFLPEVRNRWFTALVLIILAVLVWVWISSPMVVTVIGIGEVNAPASNATVSFSISTNNTSVQTAVSNANAGALLMRTYLNGQGISGPNIAESQVTVTPLAVAGGTTRFEATIAMAAKTVDVSGISTLISNLYSNGATSVSQPILSVDNQDELDQQAFNAALKDAKSQAFGIGNRNLKLIRKIVAISQVSSPSTSTATTKDDDNVNGVFKIVKAVTVSYKMW